MNSNLDSNSNENNRYKERTLISDLLRELISLGYGKNGKIITSKDLKILKKNYIENVAFNFTFIKEKDSDDSDNEN